MVTQPPGPQQFCVRWNSYQSNLQNAFPKLLTSEHFVDVTLACENEMLKCHKVVLSACSTYFEKLLLQNPCQHPIIFMKDMKFHEMQSLVDFMYKGEVNVTQDDLPSLLKSAEALQIRGLCGTDQLLSQQTLNKLKSEAKTTNGPQTTPTTESKVKPILPALAPTSSTPTAEAQLQAQLQRLQQKLQQQAAAAAAQTQEKKSPSTTNAKDSIKDTLKKTDDNTGALSSSDCDSNDRLVIKEDDVKSEFDMKSEYEDSYYDADGDLMDKDEEMNTSTDNTSGVGENDYKSPHFAIANVSCEYDGSPSSDSMLGSTNRRVRRSDEELRRAAECITRGQTFQTVSDQFNIPISTIRFYMARKGILPRRKRGRACSGVGMSPSMSPGSGSFSNAPGNTSPIGPPYHIVHYKLPQLGVSKPI